MKQKQYSFLLVDDEMGIIELISDLLDPTFNCTIQYTHNGKDAVELCEKEKFDCIITDYNMPFMDGLEFLENIRKGNSINKNSPFIFTSGYKPDLSQNTDILNDVLIVDKPFTLKKLFFHINCLINKKI